MINKHKPFVRICLVHLIAANMSVWLSACTTEIVEDVGEMFADEKVEETNGKFKSMVKFSRLHEGRTAPSKLMFFILHAFRLLNLG